MIDVSESRIGTSTRSGSASAKLWLRFVTKFGSTEALVMAKRPELFAAYLHVSSQWDGAYEPVVEARTSVYLFVGESDEYYGSQPTKTAYTALRDLYLAQGLTEDEITKLLVLDVKEQG